MYACGQGQREKLFLFFDSAERPLEPVWWEKFQPVRVGGEVKERWMNKGPWFCWPWISLFSRAELPVPACHSHTAELSCFVMFIFISLILPVLFWNTLMPTSFHCCSSLWYPILIKS